MQLTQKDPDTNVQLAQMGKNAQKNIDRKSGGGNMCTRKLIGFTKTSWIVFLQLYGRNKSRECL